jgi:hypothetical protein
MQKHLDDSCASCKQTFKAFESIVEFAKRETRYEPPADAFRIAEAYLIPLQLALRQAQNAYVALLKFDSFRQQPMVGVRGTEPISRQLQYVYRDMFIDMRLDPEPESNLILLTGQVVGAEQSSDSLAGLPVSLLSGRDTVSQTTTSQFGDFHFSFRATDHLQLIFGMKQTSLVVLLPDSEVGTT